MMNGKMQLIYLFRIRDLNLLCRLQNLNEILKDFSQVYLMEYQLLLEVVVAMFLLKLLIIEMNFI